MLMNQKIDMDQACFTYLDSIIGNSSMECINHLRMDRITFRILCELCWTYGIVKMIDQYDWRSKYVNLFTYSCPQ